ncbi:hypothetical protein [Fimbriimonas ginsengisoli]|uniref:Uncharacterized protein n=1 Tax=Fimbriimonas ginsengisoli Gsoil 348 TaxID=661478 RepID=A0A068NYI3_FIMGI|nr:hypothetical protein [Fimbriimonas ginsengisoli]AIE86984.1 hypothetical protein OP10G_3616 [Fimbriimonas ginsengisoli Gsoil 348]
MPGAPGALDKVIRLRPSQGSGGAFNQKEEQVANSQTIRYGDIVSLSSGKVQQSIALPGSNNTASSASGGTLPIYGIALADIATNSAGTEASTGRNTIPVAVFDSNLELLVRIYNATPSSSTQAALSLGTTYQFVRYRGADANTWWYMVSTTSTGEFKFVEASAESQTSDNYGMVWLRTILSDTVRQG